MPAAFSPIIAQGVWVLHDRGVGCAQAPTPRIPVVFFAVPLAACYHLLFGSALWRNSRRRIFPIGVRGRVETRPGAAFYMQSNTAGSGQ